MPDKDALLPPRPGEKPMAKEIKGVPVIIYINGEPVTMSKSEAIGILAQITQIFDYLDRKEQEGI